MVMEDVAVFGGLFSRLRSWDQVPSLMEAFQELRQARTGSVARQDISNAEFCSIPPGPDRDARNEGIRRNANIGFEGWDDERLQRQWDEIGSVYSYSAMDACDEWWSNWGMLGEMAKMRGRDRMEINISVIPGNTGLISPLSHINKRMELGPY
jgi:salicylate hydroxylase